MLQCSFSRVTRFNIHTSCHILIRTSTYTPSRLTFGNFLSPPFFHSSPRDLNLEDQVPKMAKPLTQADLIFPTQSLSTSSTLSSLRRSALSISNRLSSITKDAKFVQAVSEAYRLPLVANERCGGWYMSPEKKVESVYFKSTDGHTNEWKFSTRRLNLQVLDVVEKYGGYV